MENHFSSARFTFLMMAAQTGSIKTVQKASKEDSGHIKNTVTSIQNGNTALSLAVKNSHLEVSEYLLNQSADVNTSNNSGLTPLAIACWNKWEEGVLLLLKHGADVNACDKRGWSPLSICAFQDCGRIVEIMLKHGADVKRRDSFGKLALDRAKSEEVKKLFKEAEDRSKETTRIEKIEKTVDTENQTLKKFLKCMKSDLIKSMGHSNSSFKPKKKKLKPKTIRYAGSIQDIEIPTNTDQFQPEFIKSEQCTAISFNTQESKSSLPDNLIGPSPTSLEIPFNNTGFSSFTNTKSIKSISSSAFYRSEKSNLPTSPRISDISSDLESNKPIEITNIILKQQKSQICVKPDKIQHKFNSTTNTPRSPKNGLGKSIHSPSVKSRKSYSSFQSKSTPQSPRSTQKFLSPQNGENSKRKSIASLKAQFSIRADAQFSKRMHDLYHRSQCIVTQQLITKLSKLKQDISTKLQKSLDLMNSRLLVNIQNIMKYTSQSLSTVPSSNYVKRVIKVDRIDTDPQEDEVRLTEDEPETVRIIP